MDAMPKLDPGRNRSPLPSGLMLSFAAAYAAAIIVMRTVP
jgi:hypothetical protein